MISFLNDRGLQELRNFRAENIGENALAKIIAVSKKIRKDVLQMTMNANSGHIGGSLSSADVYLVLWLCANITPQNPFDDTRDRIVVSHGHTSPGLYAVLGNLGFFDIRDAVENFRKKNSLFEGHPSCHVPGVEWGSGSLGQGLSVGCGFAMAARIKNLHNRVYVVMGDGEQQKGQLTEAAEFAAKHSLHSLTAIIDVNGLQASGTRNDIMPSDLSKKYVAAGWEVLAIDGHDFTAIYQALKYADALQRPVLILANTVMAKGISFVENNYEYHGKLLSKQQHEDALKELGADDLEVAHFNENGQEKPLYPESEIKGAKPIIYNIDKPVECRTAAGEAIYDIIRNNRDAPVAVVDCDLMESVKTIKVYKEFPDRFIECGIQEHNAATVAGALSKAGVIPFFLDFGVFGLDETWGQHRMNDTNETSIKVIATHCGLDVGEDGKTHQCIDYISLVNNLPGYKLIIPADANQTDRAIRYVARTPGNFVVAMGRSKVPVLRSNNGEPFYGSDYTFNYGEAEWICEGDDACIISTGTMVHRAVAASDQLREENLRVGVLNISCPKDIDVACIKKACDTGIVITYEDHFAQSGLGSLIASIMAENGFVSQFKKMGVTKYGKSCSAEEQYPLQWLDILTLKETIRKLLTKATITIN